MHNRLSLKKGLAIGIIGIGLFLTSTGLSFAGEGDSSGGHGGMNMGGGTSAQAETKSNDAPKETSKPQLEPHDTGTMSGHEATPAMDPDMPGHGKASNAGGEKGGGHGEESSGEGNGAGSGGHGEGASDPEGVNRPVVWGFAGINALVVAIAGILKFMKNDPTSAIRE